MAENNSGAGTRFLLYPQAPTTRGYEKPELVWISDPLGTVGAGPSNDRMYVVDPAIEKTPYEFPFLPPYNGPSFPMAEPGPDGHFDHLDPDSREFLGAHVFGCVARVLDIWESYLGHRIDWHFAGHYQRLEILPLIEWDNAQSGFGYLEFGYDVSESGAAHPYALNFDVIAHEIGHSLLFAEIGLPPDGFTPGPDFVAYHEGISDLCSLIGMLHFDTAMDRLLRRGSGNLLAMNELNAFAELADERQVRIAGNARKMSEVGEEPHDRSRPFTGAFFDAVVETYHNMVVDQGLVDLPRHGIADARDLNVDLADRYGRAFEESYDLNHFRFKAALSDARDIMGTALARSWATLDNQNLDYVTAGYAVCDMLQEMNEGRVAETVMECLYWREILNPFDTFTIGQGRGRNRVWV